MKLSTRFGIGAAIAVVPLLGVIGFTVDRMQTLAASNERLAGRAVLGLEIGTDVTSRLDRLDEYERKQVISKDPDYAARVRDTIDALQLELARLHAAAWSRWSPAEVAALDALDLAFGVVAGHAKAALDGRGAPPTAAETDALFARAADLQQQLGRAAGAEADEAGRVRAQMWQTALGASIAAVVITVLALLLIVRALKSRLDQFIRGTEAVSTGAFSYQLDSARDDELDHAAAAFNQMVGALGELDRIKSDFISSVSHELRTPLVAMHETTQLLLDEVVGPLSPRQRHMLEMSSQAGARLSRMITELLDLSRLKGGMLQTGGARDLAQLTRTAVSQLEALALERKIELRTDIGADDLVARCDPDRYTQVVQNLVENAIKYTPSGGVIEVHLQRRSAAGLPAAARVGDRPRPCALLRIEDSGPGIPEPDRARVFEKFFRRGGLSSDGGAGLGLAICREIVEAHGGSVWIEDAETLSGAALNVALPLTEGEAA